MKKSVTKRQLKRL